MSPGPAVRNEILRIVCLLVAAPIYLIPLTYLVGLVDGHGFRWEEHFRLLAIGYTWVVLLFFLVILYVDVQKKRASGKGPYQFSLVSLSSVIAIVIIVVTVLFAEQFRPSDLFKFIVVGAVVGFFWNLYKERSSE